MMIPRLILAAAVLPSLLLSGGCFWLDDDDELKPAPLVEFQERERVRRDWSVQIGGGVDREGVMLNPALRSGTIYVAATGGTVQSINADTGKRNWTTKVDAVVSGGPGVGEGLVVVGGLKGQVIALSADNGSRLWQAAVSSEVLSSPVADRGMVVVRSQDGRIYGLRANDGRREWVFDSAVPTLTLRGNNSPASSSGFVYAGLDNGNLVALRIADGTQVWQEPVSRPQGRNVLERLADVDGHVAVVAGDVYAVGYQGRLRAFAADSGRTLWARELSSAQGVAATRNLLAVTDSDDAVWALDRLSGGDMWKQDALYRRLVSKPVFHDDYIAVADFEGYIHWLNVEDGSFVARTSTDSDGLGGNLLVHGDRLIAYGRGGRLVALRLADRG